MSNIQNPPISPQAGIAFLNPDEFDGDEATWYIEQRAVEIGADPNEAVREVRAAVARRSRLRPRSLPSQPPAEPTPLEGNMPWPPGRAGRLARFLFQTSYSPIQEVAITATLGLLAGVCGRAYRTHTGKDLALYLILVAQSGVGKDALHEGIPMLLDLADRPRARDFVRATDFASGEALHKTLLRAPGFLYLQGEFGKKLKRMANPTDAPMQSFRNIMLMAYGKRFLEGKEYSNPENSLNGVDWPALSFVGETTPRTFLECLNPDMMEDGFMSRFLVVSYGGGRPLPNTDREATLAPEDANLWSALIDHAADYQGVFFIPPAMRVEPDADALAMLDAFDVDCIARLNATDDETARQVWSRAHIKVLKIAALLAVADHYLMPTVTVAHVGWAIDLVQRDVETFQSRQRDGDIGVDDDARERKLVSFLRDYISKPVPASYSVKPKMVADGVVPRKFLQTRSASLPAFSNHKLGASRAMDEAIRSLIANGKLIEVKQDKLVEGYGFFGKSYRILEL